MAWSQLGVFANGVLTVAYMAITVSILLPLARTGQLWRNRLGLSTGLIFFTCGVGHAIHVEHAVHAIVQGGWGATDFDWHLGVWDAITACCAITYWRQRQVAGPPVDAGTLFEDLRRRQHELEAEAMQAGLRAELAIERELAARQSFARAFESAPNGMALIDGSGTLVRANAAFASVVGRGATDLAGVPLDALVDDPSDIVRSADEATQLEVVEVRLAGPDGPGAWARIGITSLDDGTATALVQLEDITDRREAQARLNHLALHDPLTGLPNRLLFHDRATLALSQGRRTNAWTGCLFIDLDHFKVVNDSLGHTAGDRVLKAIAERLLTLLRPGDTVARMGGDEFCVLLQDLELPEEATVIAERVLGVLDGYVDIDGLQVTTGASIGVAVVRSATGVTSQTLVRDADTALYRAKGNGRGHHVVFDDTIRDDAQRRLRVEAELRRGLAAGEIVVAYQPQWSRSRGRIVGVEALARWHHPTLGLLEPAEFLDVAVETGLILDLGRTVLDQALEAMAGWLALAPDLELAVNLSARQLARPHFVEEVQRVVALHGVPVGSLCLELTETDLTALGRSALGTLDALRGVGIRLAVDDVGTGQSSLTHLVTLPVDVIKIDRSFVEQVHVPGPKRAVVEALLSLARTIGVDVVAEGAETDAQVATLDALGCDVLQGYVVSRPIDASGLTALLMRPNLAMKDLASAGR
jgi:diguanylate cyclase (GGDEF)-like protein/PAS domain S-box-containing protein